MTELYTPEGWLNFDYINNKEAWLIVILGARQVGKTYGALFTMLKNDYYHILLRRTTAELELIQSSEDLNPYKVYEPEYRVGIFKAGKDLATIADWAMEDNGKAAPTKIRGLATSLPEIGKMRGFNGSKFSDLVFDEFIPEKGVIRRKAEGDMFLNAYTTINGNRELKGEPPLRVWLLANTNDINSPILEALNLTDNILYMRRKGLEELLTDSGVCIIQPKSTKVLDRRKETALMKQLNRKSEFYGMAIENEFSYDQSPFIKNLSIKQMSPAWSYDDLLYCWENSAGYYICRAPFRAASSYRYSSGAASKEKLRLEWSFIKQFYYAGLISFSDLRLLALFKNLFDIK